MRTRRIPARPFGVALLAVTATGILLQLGPVDTSRALTRRVRSASTRQQTLTAYAKLPLAFTVNAGQTDRRVRYSRPRRGLCRLPHPPRGSARPSVAAGNTMRRADRSRSASSARARMLPSTPTMRRRGASTTCSATTQESGAPACAPTSASSTTASGRASTWLFTDGAGS